VKLVVGLGNPGPRYADTRHNVGVRVIERFARDHAIALDAHRYASRFGSGEVAHGDARLAVALLAPETFMNRSGEAVVQAASALEIVDVASDLVVVFDDVDLPFGRLRLRPSGGAGGHRGLADVIERLARTTSRGCASEWGAPRPSRTPSTTCSRRSRRRNSRRCPITSRAPRARSRRRCSPVCTRR
jgi:PTH1 family peptidyl-tRNA hydrolase